MRVVAFVFVALFTWLHLLFKRSPATMDSAAVCQNVDEKCTAVSESNGSLAQNVIFDHLNIEGKQQWTVIHTFT